MEVAIAHAAANPYKRRRVNIEDISQDYLKSLWIRCLVSCHLAFNIVTNPEFRAFILYLNAIAKEFLPKSASGIRA